MIKKLWVLLSVAWVLTLAGSFILGRSQARGWGKAAQVECLRKMWGQQPFTVEELKQVRSMGNDPEILRAFLLDWANRDIKAADLRVNGEPRETLKGIKVGETVQCNIEPWIYAQREKAKAFLEAWVPGQTKFTEPRP